ncbi:hypothetical protein [Streptomyces sp. NPDC048191]|uniref:hypothetical protein n=1 Tax=Streptomyces sp. NPDC048191 TaxID=3155484 RepID=UPI0033C2D58F
MLPDVTVRPATAEDRPTVERLWLMFRHDASAFRGVLPAPDGSFRGERVPVRVPNSFLVVSGARRRGVGCGP